MNVKTLTVQEAQSQLGELIAEANKGSVIVLTDGREKVTLQPGVALNLEEDSPELERELLKAIDGPYTPYSVEEMRNVVERIIREEKRGESCAAKGGRGRGYRGRQTTRGLHPRSTRPAPGFPHARTIRSCGLRRRSA